MTPLSGEAPPQASSTISPDQAVDDFLKRLPAQCRLLVAFSGGGDSTGLLAALSRARGSYPNLTIHSATVDHGLRMGSADEARAASLVSRKLGVSHAILDWTGDKPASGIQAAAREARYRLLAAEARRIGADLVVTGHTIDDQGETIAMRQARNPLAAEGMDEAVLVDRSIWVARPFLNVEREAIRDDLRKYRLSWSEDPSNDNPAFERVRIRQSGVPVMPLSVAHRPNLNVVAAEFVDAAVRVIGGCVATVDLGQCHPRHQPHWLALSMLAAILGGREYGPDSRGAMAIVDRLAGDADFRISSNRVLFHRKGRALYLYREDRGLPAKIISPGSYGLWDGRYEIVNGGSSSAVIGAGKARAGVAPLLSELEQDALPRDVWRRATAAAPRVVEGEAGSLGVRQVLAPFDKFIPSRRLVLANSLATVFGLKRFPSSPLVNGAF